MFLDLILRAQHFVQKSGGKSGTPEKNILYPQLAFCFYCKILLDLC